MPKYIDYNISQLRPYINWLYFYFAWGLSGKPQEEKDKLRAEAEAMLDLFESRYKTHAAFELFEANSDMDDIIIGGTRLPMLRQQRKADDGEPNMCLADFVRPVSQGIADHIGVFATSIDSAVEHDFVGDDFKRMLSQTLADRLAEATAEVLHLQVRRTFWGYAHDEQLSIEQILHEISGNKTRCGLSVNARYQCKLHYRPSDRYEEHWYSTYREWGNEATCICIRTDVCTPKSMLLRHREDR